MTIEQDPSFIALTIHVAKDSDMFSTGLVDQLGEDIDGDQKALLYKVIWGLSALLRTDMARIGAVGELNHIQGLAEDMQESILADSEEEDGPQTEIVFEAAPELEERIRRSELH